MKPRNITLRLAMAFGLLAAVLVVVGWQGISQLHRLNAQMQNVVYQQWGEEQLADEALHLSDANSRITLLVFLMDDQDEIQRLLVQSAANTRRISELASTIEPLLEPGKETELFAAVNATRTPYIESYKLALSLLLTGHKPVEARKMMVDVVQPNLSAYHDAWNAFVQRQADQINQIERQNEADFATGQRNFLLILILAGLIAGATTIYTVMHMNREMAVSHRAEQALQQAHDALEVRVIERIADLAKANEALQAENMVHRKAEESLRLLSSAVEQSKESIVITDAELDFPGPKIIFINPAFTKMTGYTAEESIGKTPRILQGPRTDRTVLSRLRQNLERGESFAGEAVNYRKDGTEFDLEWQIAPIRNAGGKIIHFVAIQRDITERKRVEHALRESNEKFQLVVDNITDVFWIRSPDMREVLYISPAFEQVWGRPVADLHANSQQWADFILPEDRERVRFAFAALTGDAPSLEIEYRIMRPNGEIRWARVRGFQVRDTAHKLISLTGTITDVTERKRLETQLFQSQKMETVGKLAGGIAHEFNSILTAIMGQSELLLEDLPAGSPLLINATEIRKAADRAATLTRQLLAYGRKQILQPEILDLNAVLSGMESALRHLLNPGTDMHVAPADGQKMVKADAGQIEQIIMNMVLNARDAMPDGGKLTLETANVSLDQDSIGRYPELKPGDYVMLAITDTGAGMSEEVKARIFDPFFSTKGFGQRTGLGLSTCYGIAKQSGGHISVYSEPGRGTTFKIYLPQVTSPTKISIAQLDSPDLPCGTETILLVEDDPALREMAATLLRRLGYTVLAAANGINALSLKQQHDNEQVDLLFTDVVMPHMNGKELADRVRALCPRTRILFTSAYTENAIVHQGVLDKGVALLQKPFTPSALARKLREVLDQPDAQEPNPTQKMFGFSKS